MTTSTDRPVPQAKRRATRLPAKQRTAAKAVKPIRFESLHETRTGTNDEHIKILLDELPWMRMAIAILNLNDRDLEAKIYGSDQDTLNSFLCLMQTLTGIRDRYQAGIDICDAANARLLVVFDRLQAEAAQADPISAIPAVGDRLISLAVANINPKTAR